MCLKCYLLRMDFGGACQDGTGARGRQLHHLSKQPRDWLSRPPTPANQQISLSVHAITLQTDFHKQAHK